MSIKFKNHYNQIGRKEEFKISYDEPDMTDQSQLSSASITEMAKRYGIDAIMAKAQQRIVEENSALAGKLYGNDYSNMFTSKEEMLNVKKKLNNVFENIPAIIRKEVFKDNPMEFINAYTTNDETKLEKLAEIGLVSQTQLENVKQYNANQRAIKAENETRKAFITELEKQQGALYETFKTSGNINLSINNDNTKNTTGLQGDLPQSNS